MRNWMQSLFDWFIQRGYYKANGGLNKTNVIRRSVRVGTHCATLLVGISIVVYFPWDPGFKVDGASIARLARAHSEAFMSGMLGLLGAFGAIFIAFEAEFVAKYRRLADIHDDKLPEDFPDKEDPRAVMAHLPKMVRVFVSDEYLNFASDCLIYHMEKEASFVDTFSSIVAVLIELETQCQACYADTVYGVNELAGFVKNLESADKQQHRERYARLIRVKDAKQFGCSSRPAQLPAGPHPEPPSGPSLLGGAVNFKDLKKYEEELAKHGPSGPA